METIGTSDDRDANICDEAKDKGNTAIDDDCKIENMQQEDEQMAYEYSDCDSDSDTDYRWVRHPAALLFPLYYKPGELKAFEAKHFKSASKAVQRHRSEDGIMIVHTSKETLELLEKFCKGYAKIKDQNATSKSVNNNKNNLMEFTCEFVNNHWPSAIELVKAAFELDIQILLFWMMMGVDRYFRDKDEDEVYDLFFVNLKNHDASVLMDPRHFRHGLSLLATTNGYWKPDLLKLDLDGYRQLKNYEHRRQWLTAHFLLRDSSLAWNMTKDYDKKQIIKLERDLVYDPIYIDIEKKMKWKSKRR